MSMAAAAETTATTNMGATRNEASLTAATAPIVPTFSQVNMHIIASSASAPPTVPTVSAATAVAAAAMASANADPALRAWLGLSASTASPRVNGSTSGQLGAMRLADQQTQPRLATLERGQ